MHPAPSIIVFTAFSGLGFGLLAWLGLGYPPVTGWTAFGYFFVGYALAVGGLLSSLFHLGNPQRFLKAFSQWRSSWLSREAVISVAALSVTAIYAVGLIFLDTSWTAIGWVGAGLSGVTIFCTSMIYAQMRSVPRWHSALTPILFVTYAAGGGALLAGQAMIAALLLVALTGLQYFDWNMGDRRFGQAGSTIETATALGRFGKVRLLESPHSGTNYLLREMVHVIGRKHALKLRSIALVCLGLAPAALLLVLPIVYPTVVAAVILHVIGLMAARWLFFAEAEHVVGLYYDRR